MDLREQPVVGHKLLAAPILLPGSMEVMHGFRMQPLGDGAGGEELLATPLLPLASLEAMWGSPAQSPENQDGGRRGAAGDRSLAAWCSWGLCRTSSHNL